MVLMLRFSHVTGSEFIHAPSYDTFHGYISNGDFSYEAHPSHMALVGEWCVDQFGPPRIGIWNHHRNQIFIWGQDDIFAFKIRWC